VATLAALDVQVTASVADNWTWAPTCTAVTGAPEIVTRRSGDGDVVAASGEPSEPADRDQRSKEFLHPFPLLECEVLHVRQKRMSIP
jgi:hypothetical protein